LRFRCSTYGADHEVGSHPIEKAAKCGTGKCGNSTKAPKSKCGTGKCGDAKKVVPKPEPKTSGKCGVGKCG